ncbi:hypothetical protein ANCCAN_21076 [Ancylostoma caninum]|uniref:Uncharacterized protein n=1 Tax=Ancylostoma caninum TaxID=29170 RepID=A0A368FLJ8_ANCCA|nr:hypothetical protein ANCCAN_21076 [Ancylostoma caninum]
MMKILDLHLHPVLPLKPSGLKRRAQNGQCTSSKDVFCSRGLISVSFRLWHYSGKLIKEVLYDSPHEELWEVKFRPMAGYNKFEVKDLTLAELNCAGLLEKKKVSSEPSNNRTVGVARNAVAYVPPHLRKNQGAATTGATNDQSEKQVKMTETEKKIFTVKKKLKDVSLLKVSSDSKFLAVLPISFFLKLIAL